MNKRKREKALTLELLGAIEQRSDVTQRHLARRMGVALGLANSYLKRCVRKGLVKIEQAPANRYLYYLTPKGFAEKGRLTAEYLSDSFSFYRRAADSCSELLATCAHTGRRRIGLYGASDLAETVAVQALEHDVQIVCLCDPTGTRTRFLSHPVVRRVEEAGHVDLWLITGLDDPGGDLRTLVETVGDDRVAVPSILGLGTSTPRDE